MKKRILYLTLRKVWFDQIAHNVKKEEYRQNKPYWNKRLFSPYRVAYIFDEIWFRNGYRKNSPFMRVKWKGTIWGSVNHTIALGKILELKNYKRCA